MLHDPRQGTTPSQRLAAAHHRERIERIRSAGRHQVPAGKFASPAFAAPTLRPISNSATAETVEFLIPRPAWGRVETIQRAVLAFYPKVTLSDLKSAKRTDIVVIPRQIAMYLAKELTARSLPEIGRRFGGRDHTTVLHAVRRVSARLKTDLELVIHIASIKSVLAELMP